MSEKSGKGWKEIVGAVAPAIATALGGPLAGVAMQAVSTAILGRPDGSEADVAAVLTTGGTDALLKLKEADNSFKLEMEKLGVELVRIDQQDRAGARDLAKADMRPQILLSLVFVGGYFMSLFAIHGVLFVDESHQINDAVLALAGSLVGVFTRELSGIMQFWFGSSAGSKEKTAKIGGAP